MKTIFKVSEINFVEDGADTLIFLPAAGLEKKFDQIELLQRIFTEEISIEPEPPTYSEIIQQLIDYDPQPQTKSDIAKILSLYNPDDISEIVKSLIAAKCKTADDINGIIKSYPYELNSAIFDYKYLNWTKLGTGTIARNEDTYTFTNAGVQKSNIIPKLNGEQLQFDCRVKILDDSSTKLLMILFNNINTSSVAYPFIDIIYRTNLTTGNYHFYPERRLTNNGTVSRGTLFNSRNPTEIRKGDIADITLVITTDGIIYLWEYTNNHSSFSQYEIAQTSTLNLKNIRILTNINATPSYTNGLEIQRLSIKYNGQTISQWNK